MIGELGKTVIRTWPGRYPAYWLRLRARSALETPRLRRVENHHLARALAQWGRRPVARVVTVIPTYRRPELVVEAARSALDQSLDDHVVLVIEDGGGLPALPDDPRLYSYSLDRNCGVVGIVRNIGVRASVSPWVAFLDDDNTWHPDHLERSLAAHRDGIEITYTAVERVDEHGDSLDVLRRAFDRRAMREHAFVDTSALVVRRRRDLVFPRVRLRREDFPAEDWAFVYRVSRTRGVALVDHVTVRYLAHGGSWFTDWDQARARGVAPGPVR